MKSIDEGCISETGLGVSQHLKAQEIAIHGREAEERIEMLANSAGASPPAFSPTGPGMQPSSIDTYEIVRATTKFAVQLDSRKPEDKETLGRLDAAARALTRAANYAMREAVANDSREVDAILRRNGGAIPKGEKVPWQKVYSYPAMGKIAPSLASSIRQPTSKVVDDKWRADRFDVLVRESKTAPHFTFPIPIRLSKVCKITFHGEEAALEFPTLAGGEGRVRLALCARDARQKKELRALASGEWRMGDVVVKRDRARPSKWYVSISYRRRVEKQSGAKTAAINRGIRNFLVGVSGGEVWQYGGEDLIAGLAQFQRRRREYQYASKASGRWGHGRKRTLRPINSLYAKGENWRDTKCSNIAKRFVDWLISRDVTILFVEDLSGIRDGELGYDKTAGKAIAQKIQEWPYFKLEAKLRSKCEEAGIEVIAVGPSLVSMRCPACGHTSEANRNLGTWNIECEACKHKEDLDVAAARNLHFRASGGAVKGSASEKRSEKEAKEKAKKEALAKRRTSARKGSVPNEPDGTA